MPCVKLHSWPFCAEHHESLHIPVILVGPARFATVRLDRARCFEVSRSKLHKRLTFVNFQFIVWHDRFQHRDPPINAAFKPCLTMALAINFPLPYSFQDRFVTSQKSALQPAVSALLCHVIVGVLVG